MRKEKGKERTRLSENRVLAWLVLACVAVGSVVGLGGGKLVRERNKAVQLFYEGNSSGTMRESMDAYLDRAAECAQVMAAEAQLHLGAENETASEVLDALASFGDDHSPDERYEAYTRLQTLSDALYNRFYSDEVPEADRVNFKRAYDDFWGADKYVQRDDYRATAREFNDSLHGFPANVVAGLWGVDELNTFGA